MKFSVKKGDNVLVLAGKDAGKSGEVLEVIKEEGRVVVANVNIQTHHKKPRNKDDKGGRLQSEGPIDISNVQVICPTCKKATRIGRTLVDGKSTRVCKKCGATITGAKKAAKSAPKATAKVDAKVEKPAKTSEKIEKTVETETKTVKTAKTATKSSKKA